MRTFVAIELDDECRRSLATAIDQLEHAVSGIKWVDADSAHLTIKFIGQLDENDVPRAVDVLNDAAADAEPFSMRVGRLSAFPSERRPRVIYASVEESTGVLQRLAERIDAGLADQLDVDREKRDFIPHVTLGRVRKGQSCPPLEEFADAGDKSNFGRVQVEEIVLMKSDLTPRGAVYTPLEQIALGS